MKEFLPHILLVDDDEKLTSLLKSFLKEQGFWVSSVSTAAKARSLMDEIAFDLLVLDVMMPEETGLEFLKTIREKNHIPVLMLSALGEVESRVEGLELGADDYMAKPFEPKELVLRIRRLLERSGIERKKKIRFGDFEFDLANLVLKKTGEVIYLTENEAEFMKILAKSADKTVERENLARELKTNERTVDVQIGRIRKKIEEDPRTPRYIQTVRGEGYTLRTLS